MPTYEYECKSCGRGFEIFQSMSDPPLKECPECGKEVRRLIFGGTGVIFKGSGFYVTDKGKTAASGTAKKEAADTPVACSGCPAKGNAAACPTGGEASKASSTETKTA
jgi:putative FmdB family regulatory protein